MDFVSLLIGINHHLIRDALVGLIQAVLSGDILIHDNGLPGHDGL